MRRPLIRRFFSALPVAAALLVAAPAPGQSSTPAPLQGLVDQQQVGAAGREAIRGFAAPHLTQLESGDHRARSEARAALLAVLISGDALTVSFRLTYAEALLPTLERMVGGADHAAAVNALRIAGELGTGQSLQLITAALSDRRDGVRYAAATAMRDTLRMIATDTGAIPSAQAQQVVGTIEAAMRRESSIMVLDAFIRAVESTQPSAALRQDALLAMCRAMNEQVARRRTQPSESLADDAGTMLRALVLARGLFIDTASVPRPFAIEAGAVAGHTMAFAALRVEEQGGISSFADEDRQAVSALLKAAEAVGALANVSLGGPNLQGQPVAQAVDRNDTPALRRAVDEWIGARGRLVQAPFGRPAAEFR